MIFVSPSMSRSKIWVQVRIGPSVKGNQSFRKGSFTVAYLGPRAFTDVPQS